MIHLKLNGFDKVIVIANTKTLPSIDSGNRNMRFLFISFFCVLLVFSVDGFGSPLHTKKRTIPAGSLWKQTQSPTTTSSTTAFSVKNGASMVGKASKVEAAKKSIVMGKLFAGVSKFFISPRRALEVFGALGKHIIHNWGDLAFIIFCIRAPLPLARRIYQRRHQEKIDDEDRLERQFLRSKTRKIAQLTNEVGTLFGLVYAVEIGLFLLDLLGYEFVRVHPVHQWTAGIVASLWGARNLSEFKSYVLSRANKRKDLSQNSGTRLVNRFFDILIYCCTVLLILDFLSVQTGFALRSLFGLSGVGTLVFSLASKDLVSQFLASLAIQGTNMYVEGDGILLGDGTMGTVNKLGWLNTHIRRADELVVRIPNTQISGTRVANISRTRLSAVTQTLAISYDGLDKLPRLIVDIKKEIRLSCPTLIDDGSRSFRVFWSDYKEYSLGVVVDARFRTKPFCDDYYEVREEVLMAIARATKKNDISFSYTNFVQSGIPLLSA
jgi:small-conductance mechanosensitive channel